MAIKPAKKVLSAEQLTPDFDLNIRDKDNYDIVSMKEQILSVGRILMPVGVRGEDYKVLFGNRRVRAAQELIADLLTPAGVVENLKKLDVLVYTDLTEQETLDLILDHDQKPLARSELARAVRRFAMQGFNERQIIAKLYNSLARFTGQEKKLNEVPKDEPARTTFLTKWFHGTVGNYMLSAAKMGEFIWEQFILTLRAEEKRLAPGENVEMKITRDRIKLLSQAKTKDSKEEGGWTVENGGAEFNKLIAQFKAEDAGTATKEETQKRMSVKELTEKADLYRTPAIQKAFRLAAGETDEKRIGGLLEDDEKLSRDIKCIEALGNHVDKLPDDLKLFARNFLHSTPKQFGEYLATLVK